MGIFRDTASEAGKMKWGKWAVERAKCKRQKAQKSVRVGRCDWQGGWRWRQQGVHGTRTQKVNKINTGGWESWWSACWGARSATDLYPGQLHHPHFYARTHTGEVVYFHGEPFSSNENNPAVHTASRRCTPDVRAEKEKERGNRVSTFRASWNRDLRSLKYKLYLLGWEEVFTTTVSTKLSLEKRKTTRMITHFEQKQPDAPPPKAIERRMLKKGGNRGCYKRLRKACSSVKFIAASHDANRNRDTDASEMRLSVVFNGRP